MISFQRFAEVDVFTLCGGLIFLTITVVVWFVTKPDNESESGFVKARMAGASSGSWLSELQARLNWTTKGVSMLYKAYEEVRYLDENCVYMKSASNSD